MAELIPLPLGRLLTRVWRELERERAVFDLEQDRFYRGDATRDLSVSFHGHRASTPLGPAAGPHSQLAQNIVLSFLGGARVIELKTVQIKDELEIPRPCIDLASVGYNVEWSQELKLEQSLEEYVKASMLLEILAASGVLGLAEGADRFVFDMSVGYDLAGLQHPRVDAFLRGMKDARPIVDRLRREIPDELGRFRDLDFRTTISDTLTLSTFHGCPPDEIERMMEHLLRVHGLHSVVKLNPTLLGPAEARRIFHEVLGYREVIPDDAFAKDTRWEQAVEFVGRLEETARRLGRGFGVKLTNTLIVENHRDFFPSTERQMYLSGPPLHVLAMVLVGRFRETFGASLPLSFSAGIDRQNFADAVSLGLVPVTACTDLLRPGGYGRMRYYFGDLGKRMVACGARDLDDFTLLGQGRARDALAASSATAEQVARCEAALIAKGDLRAAAGAELFARWGSEAKLANTRAYVERVLADARYRSAANAKPPPKVGTKLWLFECLTCDKCIPVCPNDANFAYVLPKIEIPVVKLHARDGALVREAGEPLRLAKKHQIATFADFCNECGNCDVFCPEDGGPYVLKPRFFGSEETFARFPGHDGFHVKRRATGDLVLGRFAGKVFRAELGSGRARFRGEGFDVELAPEDPEGTLAGRVDAGAVVDLTYFRIMDWLRKGVLDGPGVNFVNT